MMLTTWTWLPPIWLAMLPQKFSAATTAIFAPAPPDPAGADAAVEQPAAASATTVSAAATIAGPRPLLRWARDDPGFKAEPPRKHRTADACTGGVRAARRVIHGRVLEL